MLQSWHTFVHFWSKTHPNLVYPCSTLEVFSTKVGIPIYIKRKNKSFILYEIRN